MATASSNCAESIYRFATTSWALISLGASVSFFRAGEEVRLVLGGRWMQSRNPITGHFLALYGPSPDCTVRVHCGGKPTARLLVPLIGNTEASAPETSLSHPQRHSVDSSGGRSAPVS